MKDRPILFSGQMVRAILEGRKTQTRRIVKPQPRVLNNGMWYVPFKNEINWIFNYILGDKVMAYAKFPYGKVGDRLWVRETFHEYSHGILYRADMPMRWDAENTEHGEAVTLKAEDYKWKPSIFMPRWASRITLEITGVRVERLNDISEEDAIAEGITHRTMNCPKVEFRHLWESINGEGSWDENPWVWVIEFKRVKTLSQSELR